MNQEYKSFSICTCGKVCLTKKDAQMKRNHIEKQGRQKKLRIYQCPDCDFWHLSKAVWHDDEYDP